MKFSRYVYTAVKPEIKGHQFIAGKEKFYRVGYDYETRKVSCVLPPGWSLMPDNYGAIRDSLGDINMLEIQNGNIEAVRYLADPLNNPRYTHLANILTDSELVKIHEANV